MYCTQPPLQHTEHNTSKWEYSKGRCPIYFCYHLSWVLPALPTQLIQPQWPPLPSILLIEQVCVRLNLLASGAGKDPNIATAKKVRFSSLLLFHALHATSLIHISDQEIGEILRFSYFQTSATETLISRQNLSFHFSM